MLRYRVQIEIFFTDRIIKLIDTHDNKKIIEQVRIPFAIVSREPLIFSNQYNEVYLRMEHLSIRLNEGHEYYDDQVLDLSK